MRDTTERIWKDFLKAAYRTALNSPDPSNQNGAILLNGFQVVKQGFNGVTRGLHIDIRTVDRDTKLAFVVHAEQRTVLGVNAAGCTLVCPWLACTKCAQCIVEAGVERVVRHKERMAETPERWAKEVKNGNYILTSAGVEIVELSGPLELGFDLQVNGVPWTC